MTDTKAFREIVTERGIKYKYLAQCIGITSYGLQKKIDNITEFKASEISKLCEVLGLTEKQRTRIFFAKVSE